MTFDFATLRPLLQSGNFRGLFNSLGWDHLRVPVPIQAKGETYALEGVAQKRGAQVFVCPPGPDGAVPSREIRARIDTQLRKFAHEHLIIFVDDHTPPRHQVWQWAQVEQGKPRRLKEDAWHYGHTGDRILQKLDIIKFDLSEEEQLTLAGDVLPRLHEAFGSRDKVTKRFFDRFQQEHRKFLGFIAGIAAQGDRDWYASVMLNRLMFVYFIQKKGFLDDDLDYLNNRLRKVQAERGPGQFQTFYRAFLRKLFHDGLGKPEALRDPSIDQLIGKGPFSTVASSNPTGSSRRTPASKSKMRPSRAFSHSSIPTTGTSTTVRCARTTKSTPTSSATSSRSTSTRSRWARTTRRRTSPST